MCETKASDVDRPLNDPPLTVLLQRCGDPHLPSLENRVAYQWEPEADLLGYRNGRRKDSTILQWLAEGVEQAGRPASVLDVGCAYGNLLLMLNAKLGIPDDVQMHGVELHAESLRYARAFAALVPGYSNCHYYAADLTNGLPFPDSTFDCVNMGDVIEHLPDPSAALREIRRVLKPGGILVLTTPLRDSLFKKAASFLNRLSGGRLFRAYYSGKATELDAGGKPIMNVKAGHDHISEMNWRELRATVTSAGFVFEDAVLLPVMSGSSWFDRHPFLLSFLLFLEAVHDRLQRPGWAHGVCMKLRRPRSDG